MVNHIKTLLLNRPFGDVDGVFGCFYVDPSFFSLNMAPSFGSIYDRIVGRNQPVEDQVAKVNSLYLRLSLIDMNEFVAFFDKRTTPDPLNYKYVPVDLSSFDDASVSSLVFSKTGLDDIDSCIVKLKNLYDSSNDGVVSEVCGLLAYVFHLEALRRRRDGN